MLNNIKKLFKTDNTIIQLEGNVNDLLQIDNENNAKIARFIVNEEDNEESEEILDITITSVDPSRTHGFFNNNLLNEKVRITVEKII